MFVLKGSQALRRLGVEETSLLMFVLQVCGFLLKGLYLSFKSCCITGLTRGQFLAHHGGGRGSIFTSVTAFGRQAREGVNKNPSGTFGELKRLCKSGRLKEVVLIFNQRGIFMDSNAYVYVLQECINLKGLTEGKQVHAHIIQSGFKPNILLFNSLVNMYAKCGSVLNARQVFEEMPERDIFTWNIMIAGYAKHGCAMEAIKLYKQMHEEGVTPDRVTYICVLNSCASLGALAKGKAIHADIMKAGMAPDIILETALADMYAKSGSMTDARQVFDNMSKRNVVSWNALIAGYTRHGCGRDSIEIYERMQKEGVRPDRVTFICVLNACASIGDLEQGKQVHAHMIKARIATFINLENSLVNMYAKCGSMKDAREVFNNMAKRDVVSWNAMIAGYTQDGYGMEAFKSYEQMQCEGVTPDRVTFISVLNACGSAGALETGKQVNADFLKSRILPDMVLETALLDMYAKCGRMKDALQVFDNMAKQDVVTWNAVIAGYAQHGGGKEAFKMYEHMQREGVIPNSVTYVCVLNACASLRALKKGKEVHADIIKTGIASYINLETALVDMYAKCGSIQHARQVFDNMLKQNVVSWSAMIAGYAQHGCSKEAFEIYEQMQREGVTPNRVSFICILNVCASTGSLGKGKEVHADIIKAGSASYCNLENSLVSMYTKCGSIEDARQVFDNMVERDVVSWTAMIAGYAQHGCGRQALQLFEIMQQEGLKPNSITFVSLLSACSHMGLVDEGLHYFDSMSRDHGFIPTVEHFVSIVDLFGRAGQLDEAEDFIKKMPITPDASVWGALLGACRLHGNMEVAERAAKSILKNDPQDAAAYVLLMNIYAVTGRWDDKAKVRNMVKCTNFRDPARVPSLRI